MNYKYIVVLVLFSTQVWSASHHPQDFLQSIAGKPDEGEQIVQHYCAMCHAQKPMIEVGAPKIGQGKDWDPRIKEGIDHLFKHANEGYNAMPPRGGCFECTDKQLMLAISAMLPKEGLSKKQLDHK